MIAINRPSADFRIGQLVQHRRYGYRGVIVAVDPYCRAPEDWYRRNQTRPEQQQPWYHVLVDGRDTTTYAAQSSLKADDSLEKIENALVAKFFQSFNDGHYERNERPWGSW